MGCGAHGVRRRLEEAECLQEQLRSQLKHHELELERLESQSAAASREKREISQELLEAQDSQAAADQDLKKALAKLSALHEEFTSAEDREHTESNRRSRLDSRCSVLERDCRTLRDELQSANSVQDQSSSRLERELAQRDRELSELQNHLDTMSDEVGNLQAQRDYALAELREASEALKLSGVTTPSARARRKSRRSSRSSISSLVLDRADGDAKSDTDVGTTTAAEASENSGKADPLPTRHRSQNSPAALLPPAPKTETQQQEEEIEQERPVEAQSGLLKTLEVHDKLENAKKAKLEVEVLDFTVDASATKHEETHEAPDVPWDHSAHSSPDVTVAAKAFAFSSRSQASPLRGNQEEHAASLGSPAAVGEIESPSLRNMKEVERAAEAVATNHSAPASDADEDMENLMSSKEVDSAAEAPKNIEASNEPHIWSDPSLEVPKFDFSVFDFLKHESLRTPPESPLDPPQASPRRFPIHGREGEAAPAALREPVTVREPVTADNDLSTPRSPDLWAGPPSGATRSGPLRLGAMQAAPLLLPGMEASKANLAWQPGQDPPNSLGASAADPGRSGVAQPAGLAGAAQASPVLDGCQAVPSGHEAVWARVDARGQALAGGAYAGIDDAASEASSLADDDWPRGAQTSGRHNSRWNVRA
eukprot:TRINITY_DN24743_c0_g1_i1.p1 TRINITY_DN24743_c0_g1~~TRINITY_DN24743_c0_g1_i1.p1  ORF type:complete len:661 (+),score=150.35 TRINITY_DN24743_c0_g1_i1:26-1984(+)